MSDLKIRIHGRERLTLTCATHRVGSVRIIVSKFRISVSVKTSMITRPGFPNPWDRHPLDYLSESWTDIREHHSMNPFCFGIRRPVQPPPNGWFPSQNSD